VALLPLAIAPTLGRCYTNSHMRLVSCHPRVACGPPSACLLLPLHNSLQCNPIPSHPMPGSLASRALPMMQLQPPLVCSRLTRRFPALPAMGWTATAALSSGALRTGRWQREGYQHIVMCWVLRGALSDAYKQTADSVEPQDCHAWDLHVDTLKGQTSCKHPS